MSEKEKQIIKTLADKLPAMSERERGYLEGTIATAAAMSSKKEELEKDGPEKKVGREEMNIYEATKMALQEKKCMRENPTARVKVKVETAGTCTLMKLDGSHPVKGWQPTTRELLSESWEITE